MKISTSLREIHLQHMFRISRNTQDTVQIVDIAIHHDGIVGIGEAVPSARYGEDAVSARHALDDLDLRNRSPMQRTELHRELSDYFEGKRAAQAALDMAMWDWMGKKTGMPVYGLLGLDPKRAPLTSFTIGIDDADVMRQKIREAEHYPLLKIKLGGGHDEETIDIVRSETDKPIQVDVNEAWNRHEAVDKIHWLEDKNVILIEQPLSAEDFDGTGWVRERVDLPIFADENVKRLEDVSPCSRSFDGINIKLMKCGGPTEAIQMIHAARALGLQVMLGCMIETSLGISAAAHLAPLVDRLDLDGHLLIRDDPYEGLGFSAGKILLPDRPGLGVHLVKGDSLIRSE
jgi:L-alanine-DL-glutamate epimerase-like enolase superfamily enzyme